MPEEFSSELKSLLTLLRQKLNESNRLAIAAVSFQGDFSLPFEKADVLSRQAKQQYQDYVRAEVDPLFVKLGRYIVEHEAVHFSALLSPAANQGLNDSSYLVIGIRWYEGKYHTVKVW